MFKGISLFWILIVAALIRIALPLIAFFRNGDFSIFYAMDSYKYIDLAENLFRNREFAYAGMPEIERTPGYPIFLILGIMLNSVEVVTTALQIIFSCLTIYLVFKISFLIFKKKEIALLSALFYAVEPLSILYSSKISTECFFTMTIMLFLFLLFKYFDNNKIIFLILSSILLSLSAYIRPISVFLYVPVVIILFIRSLKQNLPAFIFIVTFLSLTSVWHIRNYTTVGYKGFSAIGDRALYRLTSVYSVRSNNGDVKALKKSIEQVVLKISNNEKYNQQRTGIYNVMRSETTKIILNNIPLSVFDCLRGMTIFLFSPGTTEYIRLLNFKYLKTNEIMNRYLDRGILGTLLAMFNKNLVVFFIMLFFISFLIMYYLLGIISIIFSKPISIPTLTIVIIFIYFLLLSSYAVSSSRYRHPVMPLLSIFSGNGLYVICKRSKKGPHLKT